MFTGIIEEIGQIRRVVRGMQSVTLEIKGKKVLEHTRTGDSIAVNGVCLTATHLLRDSFLADVMPETMHRSSLGQLKMGSSVNLERAMAADGRFGGHMVSGHIDGTGSIRNVAGDDNAIWYEIEASPEILFHIVEKGSITLDGISLTVAKVEKTSFWVSIIPHTQRETTLHEKKPGDIINIENDLVGKYIEKYMRVMQQNPSMEHTRGKHMPEQTEVGWEHPYAESRPVLTMDFLVEHGFKK
ncbi:MAG: riboflavin synthase [Lachnospiraceae bacterium]|nr:riboflavin synthase [Lachnospiraceae bacterium]